MADQRHGYGALVDQYIAQFAYLAVKGLLGLDWLQHPAVLGQFSRNRRHAAGSPRPPMDDGDAEWVCPIASDVVHPQPFTKSVRRILCHPWTSSIPSLEMS